MPSLYCGDCKNIISLSSIPCPFEWYFVSAMQWNTLKEKLNIENFYDIYLKNSKEFVLCENCRNIFIFWDGSYKRYMKYRTAPSNDPEKNKIHIEFQHENQCLLTFNCSCGKQFTEEDTFNNLLHAICDSDLDGIRPESIAQIKNKSLPQILFEMMKHFLICDNCNRLWMFWKGYENPPTEYLKVHDEPEEEDLNPKVTWAKKLSAFFSRLLRR